MSGGDQRLRASAPRRGEARRWRVVLAVVALAAACPRDPTTCAVAADCDPGAVCVEGGCRRACNASADCADGERCVQGACMPGVATTDSGPRDGASGDARPPTDAPPPDHVAGDAPSIDSARDASAADAALDAAVHVDVAVADRTGLVDATGLDAVAPDRPAPADASMPDQVGSDAGTGSDVATVDSWVEPCGNWLIDDGEDCDDGARYDADGCSSTCQVEPGWHCQGQPSRCCPDGEQDNDLNGSCLPTCDTAGLTGCSGHGTCSDASGTAVCTCVAFFDGLACGDCRVRVKVGGTGDGSRWDLAEDSVQVAIDKAASLVGNAETCQVRLAGGVYALPYGVTMRSRVMLLGGYAGSGTTPDLNDPALYPSVLDGQQHAYHVVRGASNSLLAGLTITGGVASGPNATQDATGGGLLLDGANNVTIVDCLFVGNVARAYGGAFALDSSSATVVDSRFVANQTTYAKENHGGGAINVYQGSTLTLKNSHVVGNQAAGGGGGLRVHDGQVTVDRCVFAGNQAKYAGGAIRVQGTSSTLDLVGSLLAGNLTTGESQMAGNGGGLRLVEGSAQVSGCTVVRNQGYGEAGLSFGTTAFSMQVRNSVGWGNLPAQDQFGANIPDISHCVVQGWTSGGAGMTSADPQFTPTLTGAWTSGAVVDILRGQSLLVDGNAVWTPGQLTGRSVRVNVDGEVHEYPVVGNTVSELVVLGDLSSTPLAGKTYAIHDDRLQLGSPAIDTGDPARLEPDLLGRERMCTPSETPGCPDMGCYEFTPE